MPYYFGRTMSPVEPFWQICPTSSNPAGHFDLASDWAAALREAKLIANIASANVI